MALRETMRAPFRSRREALAFAALLLLLLALPLFLRAAGRPRPDEIFPTVPTGLGPYSHFQRELFEERSDIDMLFVGASVIWMGIDARAVEASLSSSLGRKARVAMLAANFRGEDLYYFLLDELLARRRVKSVVLSMPPAGFMTNKPHVGAAHWWPFGKGDDALEGLGVLQRLSLYGAQVVGAPRFLLGMLRDEPPARSPYEGELGSLLVARANGGPFIAADVPSPSLPAESMLYSPATAGRFHFTGAPLTHYQEHFIEKLARLVEKHRIHPIIIHVPMYYERAHTVIEERRDWPSYMGLAADMVGVPPLELFAGLAPSVVAQLFAGEHLNANGSPFFTRTILPALLASHRRAHGIH